MRSDRLTRRLAIFAGGTAIIGMGFLTAGCSQHAEDAPSTSTSTTPTTSSTAEPTPTEKAVSPGNRGPNSFSPTMTNPPGPTCKTIDGNNCIR